MGENPIHQLSQVVAYIPLAFLALYPLATPIASGIIFAGMVQGADPPRLKRLSRKIAVNSVLFLLVFQLAGAYLLRLMGITLPIVQVAGGLVLASMGWGALTKTDSQSAKPDSPGPKSESLERMAFYPFTFPLSVGPGCMAVAITLGAHASKPSALETAIAQFGLSIGVILIGIAVYFGHAYSYRVTAKLTSAEIEGFMRVLSFILVCIGAQVTWNGIQALVKSLS
jgi:multiple antibiotic resistance protein